VEWFVEFPSCMGILLSGSVAHAVVSIVWSFSVLFFQLPLSLEDAWLMIEARLFEDAIVLLRVP
jgi:hypothetical protein